MSSDDAKISSRKYNNYLCKTERFKNPSVAQIILKENSNLKGVFEILIVIFNIFLLDILIYLIFLLCELCNQPRIYTQALSSMRVL